MALVNVLVSKRKSKQIHCKGIFVEPILYRRSHRGRTNYQDKRQSSSRCKKSISVTLAGCNYDILPGISSDTGSHKVVVQKSEKQKMMNIDLDNNNGFSMEHTRDILPGTANDSIAESKKTEVKRNSELNTLKLMLAKVEKERDEAYVIIDDLSRRGKDICTENDDLTENLASMEHQVTYLKGEFQCAKEIIDCLHHDNEVLKELCNPESIAKASLIFKEYDDENKLIPKPPTDPSQKRKVSDGRRRRFLPKQPVLTIKEEMNEYVD